MIPDIPEGQLAVDATTGYYVFYKAWNKVPTVARKLVKVAPAITFLQLSAMATGLLRSARRMRPPRRWKAMSTNGCLT